MCCTTNRCNCRNCVTMPLVEECRCCKEIDTVQKEIEGARATSCIVDHPGFEPCCLPRPL